MIDDKELILTNLDMPIDQVNEREAVISYENGNKPVLLIIEDNIEINHYIASELSDEYAIISCVNGSKGLEVARDKSPDVIISDIMMPGIDGLEVCRQVKKDVSN